ncbi:MAG: L,D-transpeptidase [Tabrizicola sp.]|nr:L,D-transpeptidase [Tabrizicola sp.]
MRGYLAALVLGAVLAFPGVASAERLVARVSISDQTMKVFREGQLLYTWPVSTAKAGKVTPIGKYTPEFLSRHHKSRKYNNAPMPFAIFYDGDYAIHGTDQISRLGKPASHGCVRLDPKNAEILFEMVKVGGMESLKVEIVQ